MTTFRNGLRDGFLRQHLGVWTPVIIGVVLFIFLLASDFSPIKYWPRIPDLFKLLAGITALVSASSYNLRIKALDYSIKLIEQGFDPDLAKRNMEKTSCILTNLVLFSFATSIVLFFSTKTVLHTFILGNIVLSVGIGSLLACCVQYIYILFAFEKLEENIMDDKCVQQRLLKHNQQMDRMKKAAEKPDTAIPKEWNDGFVDSSEESK